MQTKETLLTIEEVGSRIRLAKPTIYKLIREGKFPQQLHLSANKVVWLEREVDEWLASRVAAR